MNLGRINTLVVDRITKHGTYLVDDDNNEVMLPDDYKQEVQLDDDVKVFVYLNNNEEYVATTQTPFVFSNQFAFLEVKDVNKVGAFMDMGIEKQLLVPYAEQTVEMEIGEYYLVFCLVDEETNRLIGSCKEREFIYEDVEDLEVGDKVEILIYKKTDLGYNVIVDNLYKGLIFYNDVHKEIDLGDKILAYVKGIREDGKIDLLLEPLGYRNSIDPNSNLILKKLQENNGQLFVTDKSDPKEIKQIFGLSKKAFKRAIGNLYKNKQIVILKESIRVL